MTVKINQAEFEAGLKRVVADNINKALSRATNDTRNDLQRLIEKLLSESDIYTSLLTGLLHSEFGLTNAQGPLNDILVALQQSVKVEKIPAKFSGGILTGGVEVYMIRSDFSDLLSLASVSYPSKTSQIEWLKWLLTLGDKIIISSAHIEYDSKKARGDRSGVAIMEKGGNWRVPPQFAGTIDDNWITKTFDPQKIRQLVFGIIQKNFERSL